MAPQNHLTMEIIFPQSLPSALSLLLIDEITMYHFILLLILIFHLEKRLTVLHNELCQCCTCPEHIAVKQNVVE